MENVGFQREVVFAVSFWDRLRGLLGSRRVDGILVLAPCRAVHTLGMRGPIDVAFLAADGAVLSSLREVMPGRFSLSSRGAVVVLERWSVSGAPWFLVGEKVSLAGLGNREE